MPRPPTAFPHRRLTRCLTPSFSTARFSARTSVALTQYSPAPTAQVVGDARILVDEEITVTQGDAVSVDVLLPTSNASEEQAAISCLREEDRLAERRRQESDVVLDYCLRAEEFSDPALIREEALINAREQVESETTRGRRLLAEKE